MLQRVNMSFGLHEFFPGIQNLQYTTLCWGMSRLMHVAFEVLTAVIMNSLIFWDMCRPVKVDRCFGRTCHLHLQGRRIRQNSVKAELRLPLAFTLVSCLDYSSTFKMEATCCSETSAYFKRTTRRYIQNTDLFRMMHVLYEGDTIYWGWKVLLQ
jgi:hypothetical protein